MAEQGRKAGNWIGGVFVGIGIYRFLTGGDWVVWIIIGFLFGGFPYVARLLRGKDKA